MPSRHCLSFSFFFFHYTEQIHKKQQWIINLIKAISEDKANIKVGSGRKDGREKEWQFLNKVELKIWSIIYITFQRNIGSDGKEQNEARGFVCCFLVFSISSSFFFILSCSSFILSTYCFLRVFIMFILNYWTSASINSELSRS